MRFKEFMPEQKVTIKSIMPPSHVSPEDTKKSFSNLSETELNQLGSPGFISKEMWPSFRQFLVMRSKASNKLLDIDLTAYTPGETLNLFNHPEIKKWHSEIVNYKIPDEYKIIAFVPCGKTKPWVNASRGIYKSYNQIIKDGKYPVYFVTVSEPLGIVPMSLWGDFPQYDNPGLFSDPFMQSGGIMTSDWKRIYGTGKQKIPFDKNVYNQCIQFLSIIIKKFIENNSDKQIISFVEDFDSLGTHSDMLNKADKINPEHRYLKRATSREEPYKYIDSTLAKHFQQDNEKTFTNDNKDGKIN